MYAGAHPGGFALNDTLRFGGEGAQSAAAAPPPHVYTIVIDPGHGGRDAGCSGAHSEEKVLALALATATARRLEARRDDVRVLLTREADVFVPLHERAAVANRAQADLFVSIHCNYLVGSARTHGSETYVMGLHTADHNLGVAKRENAAVRLERGAGAHYDFDPESPEGHIILSMFQHAFLEESLAVAADLETHLGARAGRRSRGVKQAGFMVLKETAMPSVLVETGYLSNAAEEAYLLTEAGIDETADALYAGIVDFVRRDRRQRGDRAAARAASARAAAPAVPSGAIASASSERRGAGDARAAGLGEIDTESDRPAPALPAATPPTELYVQLAAVARQLPDAERRFGELGVAVRYVREGGMLKYQAGPLPDLTAANAVRRRAARAGAAGAFVVAYRGAERVALPGGE